jgi:integrase/recombinase XerD
MLSPYTRHYEPCKQTNIFYRRCHCPKWIQGTLPDGRALRKTAKTRSWEKAEALCRRLEDEANPNKPELRPRAKIADAVQTFREDEDSRGLTDGTIKKSRYFFETQLKGWAKKQGLVYLDQLTPPLLTKFRASWENAPQTVQRKHERLLSQGRVPEISGRDLCLWRLARRPRLRASPRPAARPDPAHALVRAGDHRRGDTGADAAE